MAKAKKIKTKMVECPECNGAGEVTAFYKGTYGDAECEMICPCCCGNEKIDEKLYKILKGGK
jgi:DnaJ-class molecular chaperone